MGVLRGFGGGGALGIKLFEHSQWPQLEQCTHAVQRLFANIPARDVLM